MATTVNNKQQKLHKNSYTMIHMCHLDGFYYIASSKDEVSFSMVLMQSIASHLKKKFNGKKETALKPQRMTPHL